MNNIQYDEELESILSMQFEIFCINAEEPVNPPGHIKTAHWWVKYECPVCEIVIEPFCNMCLAYMRHPQQIIEHNCGAMFPSLTSIRLIRPI